MTQKDFIELKSFLASPKRIVVVPHKNPDGDAIGSALAAYHYFNKTGHEADIVSPNDFPSFLKWMPGAEHVYKFDQQNSQSKKLIQQSDIIFLLDFNDLSRVGDDMQKTLEQYHGIFVMIDHHQQPTDVAKFLYSDTSVCATAQMFYHFLEELNETHRIDKTIATCLYTGILTDTGSFRFSTTTSLTHRIAAELIDQGADNARIYNNVFDQNSYNRMQLLGRALQNLVVLEKYQTAYITVSEHEKDVFNFQKGDTEGVVNYSLSIKNIIFGVIFIEDRELGIVKISFRSKGNFSVNQFARDHFQGGGHDNAAGGKSHLSMEDTIEKFVELLPLYEDTLKASYEK
jgi:phosphoesterase RecJ-like protein